MTLKFSSPVLNRLQSSFFGYDRVFNDGTCVRLSSNSKVVLRLLEQDHCITIKVPDFLCHQPKASFFLSDTYPELDRGKFSLFCRSFGFASGAEYIERGQGYYDQFWFMSPLDFSLSSHLFFGHQALIDEFVLQAKLRFSDIMLKASQDRICLQPEMRSNYRGYSDQEMKKSFASKLGPLNRVCSSKNPLSDRELECMALILIGLTGKEISTFLELSVRTVEHHIDRIKDKLECRKKGQLAAHALKLQEYPEFKFKMEKISDRYLKSLSIR